MTESAPETGASAPTDAPALIRRLYLTIGVLGALVLGLAIALGVALAGGDDEPTTTGEPGAPEPVEAEEFAIVVESCDEVGASGTLESRIGDEAQVALAVDFVDGDQRLFSGRLRLRLDPNAIVPWRVPYAPEGDAASIIPDCDVYVLTANLAEE